MVNITAFFASVLAFIYILLTVFVILKRRKLKLALGDADNIEIRYGIRAHGNFSEYVPFVLLLMLINELNHISSLLLIIVGSGFVIGRLAHAFSLLYVEPKHHKFVFRPIGMALTLSSIFVLGFALIVQIFSL